MDCPLYRVPNICVSVNVAVAVACRAHPRHFAKMGCSSSKSAKVAEEPVSLLQNLLLTLLVYAQAHGCTRGACLPASTSTSTAAVPAMPRRWPQGAVASGHIALPQSVCFGVDRAAGVVGVHCRVRHAPLCCPAALHVPVQQVRFAWRAGGRLACWAWAHADDGCHVLPRIVCAVAGDCGGVRHGCYCLGRLHAWLGVVVAAHATSFNGKSSCLPFAPVLCLFATAPTPAACLFNLQKKEEPAGYGDKAAEPEALVILQLKPGGCLPILFYTTEYYYIAATPTHFNP